MAQEQPATQPMQVKHKTSIATQRPHSSLQPPSTFIGRMASCRPESQAYRTCLKDARSGGGKCTYLAQTLEACRAKVRASQNQATHEFDGTRTLPSATCKPLNQKVQHCLKWKKGDASQCQDAMAELQSCLASEQGTVTAPPTEGDKIWSDYKGPK